MESTATGAEWRSTDMQPVIFRSETPSSAKRIHLLISMREGLSDILGRMSEVVPASAYYIWCNDTMLLKFPCSGFLFLAQCYENKILSEMEGKRKVTQRRFGGILHVLRTMAKEHSRSSHQKTKSGEKNIPTVASLEPSFLSVI